MVAQVRSVMSAAAPAPLKSGLGCLCPEAQADGVPCDEIGKECSRCPRAYAPRDPDQVIRIDLH